MKDINPLTPARARELVALRQSLASMNWAPKMTEIMDAADYAAAIAARLSCGLSDYTPTEMVVEHVASMQPVLS